MSTQLIQLHQCGRRGQRSLTFLSPQREGVHFDHARFQDRRHPGRFALREHIGQRLKAVANLAYCGRFLVRDKDVVSERANSGGEREAELL